MAVLNKEQNQWKRKYGITFIIEPGFDISNGAGFLISSVVDIFKRGGKNIAILNTSVNHLPNVFSYQKSPEAVGPQRRSSSFLYFSRSQLSCRGCFWRVSL